MVSRNAATMDERKPYRVVLTLKQRDWIYLESAAAESNMTGNLLIETLILNWIAGDPNHRPVERPVPLPVPDGDEGDQVD